MKFLYRLILPTLFSLTLVGLVAGASDQARHAPTAIVHAEAAAIDGATVGVVAAVANDSTVAILDGVTVVISDLPMPEGTAWCEAFGYGRTRLFKFTHPKQAWCTSPPSYSIKEQ